MHEDSHWSGPAPLQPEECNAALVLQDGSVFWGYGAGLSGQDYKDTVGEVCFNTSYTGYQEILTDPSYCDQIVTFTSSHVGNVGTNSQDTETKQPSVKGCIIANDITAPSNWRASESFNDWLISNKLSAVTGVDTRQLTRKIRDSGFINGLIAYPNSSAIDINRAIRVINEFPGLLGLDLAERVTCKKSYTWNETTWNCISGYGKITDTKFKVVAIDFGAKHNILRCLSSLGCEVIVVPAKTSAREIMAFKPSGVFLSNGPGDPEATGSYAVPAVKQLLQNNLPIFGICLGHQILALALGCKTSKMHHGHRGANHPVKNLETGQVEITSQNHGFVVDIDSLPEGVIATHISLFDQGLEGLKVEKKPVFSVQYHPEASPGPHDSLYLFENFISMMEGY